MYSYTDFSLTEIPNEVSLVLYTPRCNLGCPWCYNAHLLGKKPLSYKQIKDCINEYKDFIGGVVLSGGEPLFNPHLIKIIRYIKDSGLKVKLNTNGLVPNDVRQNLFIPFVDYINVSLKGFDHDYANYMRTNSSWALTLHADIIEYSFVYSPCIWNEKRLSSFYTFLNNKIKSDWRTSFTDSWTKPDILTISQLQTGRCLNSDYNECTVPNKAECIKVANMFKGIPKKKLMIETKEYGREEVKIK